MKILSLTFILLFCFGILGIFGGCSKEDKNFLYNTSNCNDAKRDCLNKCRSEGKGQAVCLNDCEKVRGMCEAVKTKGCLQNCNLQHGKGTAAAEQCKKRCGS
ncbi:hypothetical protein [Helicobacter sp. MIT 05-5294]|uniref:hypothetical protein n=1 Tax=Helicobacter sp. MIT 05-5294 TaxID=1548150 RepID=UPI00051FDD0B|nr:hypothetical protein [Helicobacter sp. MIT 05-5294]TLD85618.1 hypothetical protein LS69_008560 [Helicobacter sp. MIT 05-5294]